MLEFNFMRFFFIYILIVISSCSKENTQNTIANKYVGNWYFDSIQLFQYNDSGIPHYKKYIFNNSDNFISISETLDDVRRPTISKIKIFNTSYFVKVQGLKYSKDQISFLEIENQIYDSVFYSYIWPSFTVDLFDKGKYLIISHKITSIYGLRKNIFYLKHE
jgi:hypothetical protein